MSWTDRAEGLLHNVENKAEKIGSEALHVAEVFGESTLHSAIQDPIDAMTQLANHVVKPLTGHTLPTLHLIDAPPPAKPGTEDYYAEMAGFGVGKVIDFVALSAGMEAVGITAAVGSAASAAGELPVFARIAATVAEHPALAKMAVSFGKSAFTGGVFGATLMKSKDDDHFWKGRTVNGISWALAGGAGGAVAEGANIALKSLGVPIEDAAFMSSPKGIGTRIGTVVLRSTSNRLVKSTAINFLEEETSLGESVAGSLARGAAKGVARTVEKQAMRAVGH